MDALERAIRSALDKGNGGDRAYREKVYQSAFAALERALNSPNVTAENATARRAGLQQTIAAVEREHLAAVRTAPAYSAAAGVAPHNTSQGRAEPDPAPFSSAPEPVAEDRRVFDAEPQMPLPGRQEPEFWEERTPALDEYRIDADLDETVVGETRPVRRRRRPLAMLFVALTILAVLAVAAWWAMGSGLLVPASERDGSVPNPSPIRNEEGFDPAASRGTTSAPSTASSSATPSAPSGAGTTAAPRLGSQTEDANAIAIFTPGDQDDFTVPGDAVAQLGEGGENVPLRIRSGQSGSAVAFNVPQTVLQQLAGKRALFVVSAQADEGQATQISISCAFGELGDCGGRRRFDLTGERSDVIFDVDLPSVQPGSDGTIAIVSDVSNSGKAIDIYSIGVSAN